MAEGRVARKEWPHHQILRDHRQYAFRRYLQLQEAVPYLAERKAIPKNVRKEIQKFPENVDDNMNYLLAYLREAKVERFVRFIEALGDSVGTIKSHVTLIDTMSEGLEQISNADLEQVRRVRGVVKRVREGPLETEVEREVTTKTIDVKTKEEQMAEVLSQTRVEQVVEVPTGTELEHRGEIPAETEVVGEVHAETEMVVVVSADIEDTAERLSKLQLTSASIQKTTTHETKQYPGYVEPRFVSFFHRRSLAEDQSNWQLHDPAHGVRIDIPVDAVPPDIRTFAVTLHAYLNGNFEIPNEYEICTAIFTIQTHPKFEFLKPVSLKIPHSIIFECDEDPDDFVVLCAADPDTPILQTSVPPVYVFNDIVGNADLSEDYYMQADLDHFSAVAGAKKRRHRRPKSALSLNPSRQGSLNKQRRSRRSLMKKRIKKVQKGDSIGSSRQSSYEGSFDKEISLRRQQSPLLRQCSSAESDGPFPKQLQRQAAIQREDGYSGMPSPLQQQSSSIEDVSCNEICVCCCSPVQCTTNWTTRFMVAPNHPTGRRALSDAAKTFEKRCHVDMESTKCIVFPSNYFIGFEPGKWSNTDWIVSATATPQIHLDLVQSDPYLPQGQPPHTDFEAENTTNQCCSAPLCHKITVTGAEANGVGVYFTIKSTERRANRTTDVIHTQSWLYQKDSQILQAFNNTSNIALTPCADHCKLMADIALQLPNRVYDDLLGILELSEVEKCYLEAEGKSNFAERMYKSFIIWISSKRQPNLEELKSVLVKVGIQDIQLCCADIPLLSENPGLYDRQCDRQLCTVLATKLGMQWQFLGRYLGLTEVAIEDLVSIADREGRTEAVSRMLHKWQQQQCGREASVAALVKAVYRIHQLNSWYMNEAWWFIEQVVAHEITQQNMQS